MLSIQKPETSSPIENIEEPVTDRKVQLAWQLFVSLEYQVQVADRKVQAVFGLNAFLVAALSLQNQQPLNQLMKEGINISLAVDLIMKAFLLASVCIATWSALSALTPRVKTAFRSNHSKADSHFFFVHIFQKSAKDFAEGFLNMNNAEAAQQILAQSQAISSILTLKYKMLHRSTVFLSIALMIWILLAVNRFLA